MRRIILLDNVVIKGKLCLLGTVLPNDYITNMHPDIEKALKENNAKYIDEAPVEVTPDVLKNLEKQYPVDKQETEIKVTKLKTKAGK